MKKIETLIEDIQDVLVNGASDIPKDALAAFGESMVNLMTYRLTKEDQVPRLRMSNIGSPCERKLWLEINQPQDREDFTPETYLKFLYGDLLEELLLFLAQVAGHKVEGRQSEQDIEGIKGHRDAVIDGVLVDVKSASNYAFKKFKEGTLDKDDPFGYRTQLQSYLFASQDDPVVTDKSRAAFFVIDKTSGHLCLNFHAKKEFDFPTNYKQRIAAINSPTVPPRSFAPVEDGKSGNMKLDTFCSYCPVKSACYPNLRTFLYSNGPRFLTTVVREPNAYEAT